MTQQEEALLRIAVSLLKRLRRLARKVDGISGTDVTNLRDTISIGGGGGGGSGGITLPPEDPLVIIRITTGSGTAAGYNLGGTYQAHIMTRNATEFDLAATGTLNIADYFDVGEEVVAVNFYEDNSSGHILDVTGETYYTLAVDLAEIATNGKRIVWTSTPSLRSCA